MGRPARMAVPPAENGILFWSHPPEAAWGAAFGRIRKRPADEGSDSPPPPSHLFHEGRRAPRDPGRRSGAGREDGAAGRDPSGADARDAQAAGGGPPGSLPGMDGSDGGDGGLECDAGTAGSDPSQPLADRCPFLLRGDRGNLSVSATPQADRLHLLLIPFSDPGGVRGFGGGLPIRSSARKMPAGLVER